MSPFSSSFRLPEPRHPGLDAARGFAVVAMVLGHTLDALLSPAARAHPWVGRYWEMRGLTAPLFLLVSGWAVVAVLGSRPRAASETYGRRVRRGLLLVFLGYLLKWPGLGVVKALGWGEPLRERLFLFDALQCIGLALLVGATVLLLTPNVWARAGALLGLAVSIPLATTAVWQLAEPLPAALRLALGGPGTQFPLFPWAGFFFAGAFAAHVLRLLRPGWPQGVALGVLGGGLLWLMGYATADWGPKSAYLVGVRVAMGLLALGAFNLLPTLLTRPLAPMGRMSLWLYVLHLPVVYGWGGYAGLWGRVGQKLEFPTAFGIGVAVLAGSTVLALLGRRLLKLARPWQVGSTTLAAPIGTGQQRV